MITIETLRWVNIVGYACVLAMSLAAPFIRPRRMWYLLPGNMLAIHGLVFYASLLTGLLTAETANIWSTALRLHSILTILTLMLALLIMPRATVFSETTGGKK